MVQLILQFRENNLNMNELDKMLIQHTLVYGKFVIRGRKDEINKNAVIVEVDALIRSSL